MFDEPLFVLLHLSSSSSTYTHAFPTQPLSIQKGSVVISFIHRRVSLLILLPSLKYGGSNNEFQLIPDAFSRIPGVWPARAICRDITAGARMLMPPSMEEAMLPEQQARVVRRQGGQR